MCVRILGLTSTKGRTTHTRPYDATLLTVRQYHSIILIEHYLYKDDSAEAGRDNTLLIACGQNLPCIVHKIPERPFTHILTGKKKTPTSWYVHSQLPATTSAAILSQPSLLALGADSSRLGIKKTNRSGQLRAGLKREAGLMAADETTVVNRPKRVRTGIFPQFFFLSCLFF